MRKYLDNYLISIYIIIAFLLLAFGYAYEVPFGPRKIIIISLSMFYLLTIFLQIFNKKFVSALTLIMAVTLIVIEMNSKYAINYFYHSMYIVILMYIVFYFSKKQGFVLSIVLSIGSLVKFIELIWIQPSQANVAIFLFFLIIQLLVLLVGYFAKVYREENAKTNLLYTELLETNKKLIQYSDEIQQLTKIEERTNIARDLHDTLGHDMTGLIMQMEMASRLLVNNKTDQGLNTLEEAKKSARDSLGKVRQILNTLKNDSDIEWTNASLQALVNEFAKKTNTTIECKIIGERNIKPDVGITLYRSIQEALTNAIRHGKALKILVTITYQDQKVVFSIEDDGIGCSNILKGNGLTGMIERIKLLMGEVTFDSHSHGFSVKGSIPYEREELE